VNGWLTAALILTSTLVLYSAPGMAQSPAQRVLMEDICDTFLATGVDSFTPEDDPPQRDQQRLTERLATLVARWTRGGWDDVLWRTTNGGYGFRLCAPILGRNLWPPLFPGKSCEAVLPTRHPCGELERRCQQRQMFVNATCIPTEGLVAHARCTPLVSNVAAAQCQLALTIDDARCKASPEECAAAKASRSRTH